MAASLDRDLLRETRDAQAAAQAAATGMGNDAALVLIDLTKLYKSGRIGSRQDVRAVDSITLVGRVGECVALVGHNGAGKSTLVSKQATLRCWRTKLKVACRSRCLRAKPRRRSATR